MLLSLMTLLVVMLFTEARIDRFLHGEPEPEPQDEGFLADTGDALTSFWNSVTGAVPSPTELDTRITGEKEVVITPDTVQQVWVWKGDDGAIRSARTEPEHDQARRVLIPENMTAAEFFAGPDPAPSGQSTPEESASTATPDRDADRAESRPVQHNPAAGLEQLSPEQRRATLNQGMEVLRRRSAGGGQPPAR